MSWTRFLWRNLSRNKLRSLLTGAAIALAVALVCFLATMPDGLNRLLDRWLETRASSCTIEAGLVYWLPYAYLQKIRAHAGRARSRELDLFRRRLPEGWTGIVLPEPRDRTRSGSARCGPTSRSTRR